MKTQQSFICLGMLYILFLSNIIVYKTVQPKTHSTPIQDPSSRKHQYNSCHFQSSSKRHIEQDADRHICAGYSLNERVLRKRIKPNYELNQQFPSFNLLEDASQNTSEQTNLLVSPFAITLVLSAPLK
jgi:hypothetical protein